MKKVIPFILFSLALTLLLNCNILGIQTQSASKCGCVVAPSPVAFFGKTYINFAWGFHHNAWYITESGSIDTVTYTRADSLWIVNDDSLITYSEMGQLLNKARPNTHFVNYATLDSMKALIPLAAMGSLSKTYQGADMGSYSYSAFYYDSTIYGYREVLLYQYGDVKIVNESDAAKKLTAWLVGIDSTSIGKK